MRAFLMAAGIGSRIKNITSNPKSLLKVKQKTIIRHTVEMLLEKNINVTIIVGFKEDMIKNELKDLKGIEIISNEEYYKTNSIYSLYKVCDKLEGDCIIANADVFWQKNMLNYLIEFEDFNNAVMLGDSSIERKENGDYFLKTINNRIKEYGKELSMKDRDYEYVGVAKIKSTFLTEFKSKLNELIISNDLQLWWENVLYELSEKYMIEVKDIRGMFWGEVDTEKDYARILKYIENEE